MTTNALADGAINPRSINWSKSSTLQRSAGINGNLEEAKRMMSEENAMDPSKNVQSLPDSDLTAIHDFIRLYDPVAITNGSVSFRQQRVLLENQPSASRRRRSASRALCSVHHSLSHDLLTPASFQLIFFRKISNSSGVLSVSN